MKKLFFFFLFLFIGIPTIQADSLKHFEVLNGKLSIPFDPKVNTYTVYLIANATNIEANYSLMDKNNEVKIEEDNEKAIYTVYNKEGKIEEYTFYKNLENTDEIPVFQEYVANDTDQTIPYLKYYVLGGCAFIILCLFKIIVIGFKKKS